MATYRRYTTALLIVLYLSRAYQSATIQSPSQLQKQYGDALEAIFGIGIRLQALLVDPSLPYTDNFIVSPLSLALLVTQLMVGADEEFGNELYNLLSLPDSTDSKHTIIRYYGKQNNETFNVPYAKLHSQMGTLLRALETKHLAKSFTLNCSNALFANSNLKLKDEFVHNLKIYKTDIHALNFSTDPKGSKETINNWAAAQTNGVIKTILWSPLPVTASAIFTNAIYFLAEWETPFSYEMSVKGDFYPSKDKTVEVEYMRGIFDNISYAESKELGFKVIALPYKNNEVSMYFVLPNEDDGEEYDIRKFTEKIKVKESLEFVLQAKKHTVSIQIPKLKLISSISVLEPLQRYRLYRKRFNNQTDSNNGHKDALDVLEERIDLFNSFNTSERMDILLTEAVQNHVLKVTNILQQTTLSVDEKGTEAAAVSASVIDYIGGSKIFKLTRPFVFFIRHEATWATLFWGTIIDPTKS